ncbi:MAG TPA: xanthine dehydrogenase accessory protein XdhC [Terrimicrobiaceae bacterium]
MNQTTNVLRAMARLEEAGDAFVCITLAEARGSVPQEAGAKMLVTPGGRECGTIGGGRVEEAAIKHARELLAGRPTICCELIEWNLQKDIGMTCGGVVKFLFEIFRPSSWPIAIFGAGHVAQSLVRILVSLSCQVTVFDTRPEMLSQLPQAPNVRARLIEPLEEGVREIPEGAFVVVMTQGHRTDKPVLEQILKTRTFPYLGAIGSASKAAVLRRELRESGVEGDLTHAFHCPIGLHLGKNTPEEIAISVVAQLLEVRGA